MWVPSTFQWNLIACVVVQRPSPCPVTGPVEISPKLSRSGFRQVAQSDRLEIGIRDRIHFGMLTGLIPESCPPSPGIRKFHLGRAGVLFAAAGHRHLRWVRTGEDV